MINQDATPNFPRLMSHLFLASTLWMGQSYQLYAVVSFPVSYLVQSWDIVSWFCVLKFQIPTKKDFIWIHVALFLKFILHSCFSEWNTSSLSLFYYISKKLFYHLCTCEKTVWGLTILKENKCSLLLELNFMNKERTRTYPWVSRSQGWGWTLYIPNLHNPEPKWNTLSFITVQYITRGCCQRSKFPTDCNILRTIQMMFLKCWGSLLSYVMQNLVIKTESTLHFLNKKTFNIGVKWGFTIVRRLRIRGHNVVLDLHVQGVKRHLQQQNRQTSESCCYWQPRKMFMGKTHICHLLMTTCLL